MTRRRLKLTAARTARAPTAHKLTTAITPRRLAPLLLILLAGLLLRAAYLRELRLAPDFAAPVADAAFHDYWARAVVTGDWTPPDTSSDPAIRTTPYLRPPGYPFFLALIYSIGGQNAVSPRLAQMALGLASGTLAYALCCSLFGHRSALIAAALMMTQWSLVFYEGQLQEPCLLVLLTLGLILMLRRWSAGATSLRAAIAGLLAGLCALVRPNVLLFLPLAAAWQFWIVRRRRKSGSAQTGSAMAHPLAFLAGAALAVAPVTIRNYLRGGDFVLISNNGAINLYIGNNELADGVSALIPELQRLAGRPGWSWFAYPKIVRGVEAELGRSLTQSEVSSYFKNKALDYVKQRPLRSLLLAGKRAVLFWGPAEVSNNKVVHYERRHSAVLRCLPGFPFALASALLGLMVLGLQRRRAGALDAGDDLSTSGRFESLVMIAAFIATYFASFLPFLAAERFRVPIVPLLLVFGAYGLDQLVSLAIARDLRRLTMWGLGGLAFYGFARIPWVAYEPDRSAWHLGRAFAYERADLPQQAIAECREVLRIAPQFTDARLYLADLLSRHGWIDEARQEYFAATHALSGDVNATRAFAAFLQQRGRTAEAIEELRAALQRAPGDVDLRTALADALATAGSLDEALTLYQELQRLDPQNAGPWIRRGVLLAQRGMFDQALGEFQGALRINEQNAEAHYNLGNVRSARGEFTEAIAAYQAALQSDPDFVQARTNLGTALFRTGRVDEAVAQFRRAVETDPKDLPARRNLALALAANGRIEQAVDVLNQALAIDPRDDAARHLLELLTNKRAESPTP